MSVAVWATTTPVAARRTETITAASKATLRLVAGLAAACWKCLMSPPRWLGGSHPISLTPRGPPGLSLPILVLHDGGSVNREPAANQGNTGGGGGVGCRPEHEPGRGPDAGRPHPCLPRG